MCKGHSCPKCGAPDYRQNAEWFRDNDITGESHYEFECGDCWHKWYCWH